MLASSLGSQSWPCIRTVYCEAAEQSSSVFPQIIQFLYQKSTSYSAGNEAKGLSDYCLLEILLPYTCGVLEQL